MEFIFTTEYYQHIYCHYDALLQDAATTPEARIIAAANQQHAVDMLEIVDPILPLITALFTPKKHR